MKSETERDALQLAKKTCSAAVEDAVAAAGKRGCRKEDLQRQSKKEIREDEDLLWRRWLKIQEDGVSRRLEDDSRRRWRRRQWLRSQGGKGAEVGVSPFLFFFAISSIFFARFPLFLIFKSWRDWIACGSGYFARLSDSCAPLERTERNKMVVSHFGMAIPVGARSSNPIRYFYGPTQNGTYVPNNHTYIKVY